MRKYYKSPFLYYNRITTDNPDIIKEFTYIGIFPSFRTLISVPKYYEWLPNDHPYPSTFDAVALSYYPAEPTTLNNFHPTVTLKEAFEAYASLPLGSATAIVQASRDSLSRTQKEVCRSLWNTLEPIAIPSEYAEASIEFYTDSIPKSVIKTLFTKYSDEHITWHIECSSGAHECFDYENMQGFVQSYPANYVHFDTSIPNKAYLIKELEKFECIKDVQEYLEENVPCCFWNITIPQHPASYEGKITIGLDTPLYEVKFNRGKCS